MGLESEQRTMKHNETINQYMPNRDDVGNHQSVEILEIFDIKYMDPREERDKHTTQISR
jgi:hypothetical protein